MFQQHMLLFVCCDKHGRLLSMLIDSLSVSFTYVFLMYLCIEDGISRVLEAGLH